MFKLLALRRRKILYFFKRFFVAEGQESEGKIKMNSIFFAKETIGGASPTPSAEIKVV